MDALGAGTHPLVGFEGVGGLLTNDTAKLPVGEYSGVIVGVVVHSTSQQPAMKEEFDVKPVPPGLGWGSNDRSANCVNKLCGQRLSVSGPTNEHAVPGDQVSPPSANVGAVQPAKVGAVQLLLLIVSPLLELSSRMCDQ